MDRAPSWPLAGRVAVRFAVVYLAVLFWPFPLNLIPRLGERIEAFTSRPLVPWVARHVLRLAEPVVYAENGSGDKTWDYVWTFCAAAIAALVALVWSLLARHTPAHPRLLACFRVVVRMFLGVAMILYGCAKLVPSQFPPMPLDQLLERYGEASPMGLLWEFMGHSQVYQFFTGAAEALAGTLLLFRRTTPAGALLSTVVLSHIVMLNFCFDVPVKLFSTQLLAMALFLLAPDLGRLARVLLGRAVDAAEPAPLCRGKWMCRAAAAASVAILLASAGASLASAWSGYKEYGGGAPRSSLRGVWAVDEFALDGQDRPPLLADADRWSRVTFDNRIFAVIRDMRDRRRFYRVELDEAARTITLAPRGEAAAPAVKLIYDRPEFATLVVTGDVGGRPVRARLRRRDESEFLLTSRGFHWVNETPFNR